MSFSRLLLLCIPIVFLFSPNDFAEAIYGLSGVECLPFHVAAMPYVQVLSWTCQNSHSDQPSVLTSAEAVLRCPRD